jgi:hypothetical protein
MHVPGQARRDHPDHWLQDIVYQRCDRISRILKHRFYVVEALPARTPLVRGDMEARNPSGAHIASVRYDAEFDRYRGIAELAGPATGLTG